MASVEQVPSTEATAEEVVNTVVEEGARLGVKRFFTIPGRDPFDEIEWETRDAMIPGRDSPADRDEHRRAEVLPRSPLLA